MTHYSLGCVTILDATPLELVSIAADAGYRGLSVASGAPIITANFGQPGLSHSFVTDTKLRKETAARAADRGVTLDQMDGFIITPAFNETDFKNTMDAAAEMGVVEGNVTCRDPDRHRMSDNLARVCEMARERNIATCLEFSIFSAVHTVTAAHQLIDEGKYTGLRILVDALHLARSGGTPADVSRVPPDLISCSQFCDGPLFSPSIEAYRDEALFDRGMLGAGELPLKALFDVLPKDRIIYLEVPNESLKQQGLSQTERAKRVLDSMRHITSQ